MYKIIKSVIESGSFELSDILNKIDVIWIQGRISEEEKAELIAMAQGKANPRDSVDVMEKLNDLEERVRKLESNATDEEGAGDTEEYPEYTAGKWYYTGDKVTFDGIKYICIAPDNVACVWSPTAYPTYWQEEQDETGV